MNKKLASMLLAGTVIIASTMAAQAEEKTIAIVPWDISQAFAAQFAEVATEAIEANGWKAVTMDPKGDWASEYTIIENLITQQVDGIIYTAIDADGANDAVELCKEAGIPDSMRQLRFI